MDIGDRNNESGITIEFFVLEGTCIGRDPDTVDLYYDPSLTQDERLLYSGLWTSVISHRRRLNTTTCTPEFRVF